MRYTLILMMACAASVAAHAETDRVIYIVNGKQADVQAAVRTMMSDEKAPVYKCTAQQLKTTKSGLGLKAREQ